MSDASRTPYSTLGNHLRFLREQQSESLAEVSGAVEIDETVLERIESGHERPAEDILMLLISHFNMQDQEAVQLWELAGYEGDSRATKEDILSQGTEQKPVVILFGIDARTMYTDTAEVQAGAMGITIAFGQQSSNNKPHMPVAKVGMSQAQAEQLISQLQSALLHQKFNSGPKALPPTNDIS